MKFRYIWLLIVGTSLVGVQEELIKYINPQLAIHKRPEITLLSTQHEEECQICLDPIFSHDEPKPVLEINCYRIHRFHYACAKNWFKKDTTCPFCRNQVSRKKQLPPEQPEGFFSWLFKLLCCYPSS